MHPLFARTFWALPLGPTNQRPDFRMLARNRTNVRQTSSQFPRRQDSGLFQSGLERRDTPCPPQRPPGFNGVGPRKVPRRLRCAAEYANFNCSSSQAHSGLSGSPSPRGRARAPFKIRPRNGTRASAARNHHTVSSSRGNIIRLAGCSERLHLVHIAFPMQTTWHGGVGPSASVGMRYRTFLVSTF